MTWQSVLRQKRKCKKVWIKYLIHVTAMISQSASKRLSLSASTWKALQRAYHHSERSTTASGRHSPTLEAHYLELCTLKMKSMLELPKLVQHLAGYVEAFGTEVESDLTQSWKNIDRQCCQHYYTHAKLGQLTNGMPKDWTTPYKLT